MRPNGSVPPMRFEGPDPSPDRSAPADIGAAQRSGVGSTGAPGGGCPRGGQAEAPPLTPTPHGATTPSEAHGGLRQHHYRLDSHSLHSARCLREADVSPTHRARQAPRSYRLKIQFGLKTSSSAASL